MSDRKYNSRHVPGELSCVSANPGLGFVGLFLRFNRPFPNCLWPLIRSESWYSSFLIKISFHLHVNESLFSFETTSTRTRFEKKAKGKSEMAYLCPTVAEEHLPTTSGINMHWLGNILLGVNLPCPFTSSVVAKQLHSVYGLTGSRKTFDDNTKCSKHDKNGSTKH